MEIGPESGRVLTEIFKRHLEYDLTDADRAALEDGRATLMRYAGFGFWTGAMLLPLINFRGQYSLKNLRNLPPLTHPQTNKPNYPALQSRLIFTLRGFFFGTVGAGLGTALGASYGSGKVERDLDSRVGVGREGRERIQRAFKRIREEILQAEKEGKVWAPPPPTSSRGPTPPRQNSPPGSATNQDEGFVSDDSFYGQKTTDDDASTPTPYRNLQESNNANVPSKWEELRRSRAAPPSTWDKIREDASRGSGPSKTQAGERQRGGEGEFDDTVKVEDTRGDGGREKERREFEKMLERERKMSAEGSERSRW